MYSVKASITFQRDVRKLQKVYPRVKQDLEELFSRLESGHLDGSAVKGFGKSVFKVRSSNQESSSSWDGACRVLRSRLRFTLRRRRRTSVMTGPETA